MNTGRKKRYSHIYIGLKVQINETWEQIKALDWNEDGFNFYLDRDIDIDNFVFKKGIECFFGRTVWKRVINDEHVMLEMILNKLLFNELDKMDPEMDNYKRIMKLIRAHGKQEEKEKLLIAMKGMSIVTDALSTLEKYTMSISLCRYGVKVVSEEWARVVSYALKASSIVQALDKVEKEILKISENIS